MSMEINGTVAKVAVGYSLKVPASAAYSSEDAHVSYSLEFDVTGKTVEEITEALEALEVQLHVNAKLAAFAQLGVDFETGPSGVLSPVIKATPGGGGQAAAVGAKPYAPSGQKFAPPKAAGRNLPVVVLGGTAYFDQRVLKTDGTYKAGAADFKSVEKFDGDHKQLWIIDRDGSTNVGVTEMMAASGVS